MNNHHLIQKLIEKLPPIEEGAFRYFDLAKAYEVTLNFIEAQAHIPSHTHEQTVFNYVVSGEFEVTDRSGSTTYRAGEWIRIEKGEAHSVVSRVETTLLEFWEK